MSKISTQHLSPLPDIPDLRRLTQSLAMLDAILSLDWQGRYYSFNSRWAEAEMTASMRNGSGDHWFLLFCPAGAILKGFAHEAPMAEGSIWSGILSGVPEIFSGFLTEPAFSMEDTTFCIWRTFNDDQWRRGVIAYPSAADPDGSEDLLSILDGNPRTYQRWAKEYHDVKVNLAAVQHVYQHRPLTSEIVTQLNADMIMGDLTDDLSEIGYPA